MIKLAPREAMIARLHHGVALGACGAHANRTGDFTMTAGTARGIVGSDGVVGAKRDGMVGGLLRCRQMVAGRKGEQRTGAVGMARLALGHAVGFRHARAIVVTCHAGCDHRGR